MGAAFVEAGTSAHRDAANILSMQPTVLLNDGGWCWFQDERAIVTANKLIFGSVASGALNPAIAGQVRATQVNLSTGRVQTTVLHDPYRDTRPRTWVDDHCAPAFVRRPDGRIQAFYSRHGTRNEIHTRISSSVASGTAWGSEQVIVPDARSLVTYSNPLVLSAESRVYDFFRGLTDFYKSGYIVSSNGGDTWATGNLIIDVPNLPEARPYIKYCTNGTDTIHMAYTEDNPTDFPNSVYHIFYKAGQLRRSSGKVICPLTTGLRSPSEGTLIFQGSPDAVGWIVDLHLTAAGFPVLLYMTRNGDAAKPVSAWGSDLRFRLANWDGRVWHDRELARAGTRLYATASTYSGLGALDPADPRTIYISTNISPISGSRLAHREIFRARTTDYDRFTWTAVTRSSAADNIRPIVPRWPGSRRILLWLRGTMTTYENYRLAIMGLLENR